MSVGINYRRKFSVGNSVAFLRFSGSELANEEKTILITKKEHFVIELCLLG
jgi:co-chaperonin GroES (HSP10)